jgi:non-ribosomal peptide synthetase component F
VSATAAPPLSVAQEALWFVGMMEPGRLSYHETISIRKDGALDVDALRLAYTELLRRHAAWRTTFDRHHGEPVQIVGPVPPVELPVADLSHLPADAAERRAARLVAERSRVPYDLRRGPLVRPQLIRFPGDHHRLYLALHHIAFDGVSLYRVVFPELVALYDAFRAGVPSPLPEPVASYADYALREQEWMEGPRAQRRLEHWRQRLGDVRDLALPLDRPRGETPRYRGGVIGVTVPAGVAERLRETGQGLGASLFQVLAAAWALLLGRWADQADVILATPADLRRDPEFEGVVGYCLTPLPLRIDLRGDPSFGEVVGRARNELLDALDRAVPFERIARELTGDATGQANPVYQAMLVLEPTVPGPDPQWTLKLLENEIADLVGNAKVDLELALDQLPSGELSGRLMYDRDLFDRATAARLAEQFARVAAAVAADPSLPVSRVPLVSAVEEERRLAEFNATAVEVPETTVEERIRAWAETRPDDPALTAGGRTRTYRELPGAEIGVDGLPADASVTQLLAGLAAEVGLGAQDTVLVLPATLARAPLAAVGLPLVAGAHVVLADELNGVQASQLISSAGVTFLHATPDEWRALIDTGLRPARSLRALSSGAALTRELADAILARCRVLWNAYETAGTYALAGRVEAGEPVTIGRPLANVRVEIVDRSGRPVPVGFLGELRIAAVATGDRARWRPDGTVELAPTR